MAKIDSSRSGSTQRRGLRGSNGSTADYESADANLLKRAIVTAARTGGALRFGYTADGGAYAIGIYGDGDYYAHYVSPHQELDITLQDIVDLFEAIADDRASGEKPAKRAK